jgi:hypothetical protein
MAEVNKCSLDNMLNAILSIAHSEKNFAYPPNIYGDQYNTVSSLVISKCADIYPSDTTVLDIIDPYVVREVIRPVDGYITLPDNFRNLLGSPMIAIKNDGCAECEQPVPVSNREFKQLIVKAGCKKVELVIVDQAEFGYRTSSTYKQPTYEKPIGYRSGKNQIKVCPPDINAVEVMYTKKEGLAVYGYDMQPDDTFVFNASKSTELLWTSAAFKPMFNALLALYTAYSRDNNLRDWALYINQNGLI